MSYKQHANISNGTFQNKIGTAWNKSNSSRQCFIDIIPPAESASNRNECQEYFLGGKAAGVYGWQSYHLRVQIVMKSGNLTLLEHSGPVQACKGIALPLPLPGQS